MSCILRVLACILAISAMPYAARAASDTDQLAGQMLEKMGGLSMIGLATTAMRPLALQKLGEQGVTQANAEVIWDKYMRPQFEADGPKLLDRFRMILAEDFTGPELQSIISDRQDDSRQSAIAKVPQMQQHFAEAGESWGKEAGSRAFVAHGAELRALGMTEANPR